MIRKHSSYEAGTTVSRLWRPSRCSHVISFPLLCFGVPAFECVERIGVPVSLWMLLHHFSQFRDGERCQPCRPATAAGLPREGFATGAPDLQVPTRRCLHFRSQIQALVLQIPTGDSRAPGAHRRCLHSRCPQEMPAVQVPICSCSHSSLFQRRWEHSLSHTLIRHLPHMSGTNSTDTGHLLNEDTEVTT